MSARIQFIVIGMLLVTASGCASNDQPRSSREALASDKNQQRPSLEASRCTDQFSAPICQDANDRRINGDVCRRQPVTRRTQRRIDPAAPVVVPGSVEIPRTPVPVPGGSGGIGILR